MPPTNLALILRLHGVTCGVKMMSLRHHGWGWQPHQTASPIHIRHIQWVWAHWYYAVHGHMLAALHSYTNTTWLRFWACGSFLLSQNDVITSWLRLTATSNYFMLPFRTFKKCLSTLLCCPWAYSSSCKKLSMHYLAQILSRIAR